MGMAARHNHDSDCTPCKHSGGHHDNDCDECDNVLSDESINHDHHDGHCVTVCGDYCADEHDELILVFANGNNVDAAGAQLPAAIELPCADDIDPCFPITVVAVDGPVVVSGLANETRILADGRPGTGSVRLELGQEGKFRAIPSRDKCGCAFYNVCVCSGL